VTRVTGDAKAANGCGIAPTVAIQGNALVVKGALYG